MKLWTWLLGGVAVIGAGVAIAERPRSRLCDPGEVFPRPLVEPTTDAERVANSRRVTHQLDCLGYPNGGIDAYGEALDMASFRRAWDTFAFDHSREVSAYETTRLGGPTRARVLALDDAFRARVNAPRAADYTAPSGGLFSPSRHRGRV
jgi:hypothetical protein